MATRREVLAATIAAPILAVPTAAQASVGLVCQPTIPGPEWNAALARLRAAEAAVSAYYATVFDPAYEAEKRQEEMVQALVDAVPHYTTKATFETTGKGIIPLTSARRDHVSLAKEFVANPEGIMSEGEALNDWRRAARELNDAVDRRDAEIAKIKADNPLRPVPQSIRDGLDQVEQASYEAFSAVVDFPAATVADLRAKIEYCKSADCDLEHDQMLADLARVFGEG